MLNKITYLEITPTWKTIHIQRNHGIAKITRPYRYTQARAQALTTITLKDPAHRRTLVIR